MIISYFVNRAPMLFSRWHNGVARGRTALGGNQPQEGVSKMEGKWGESGKMGVITATLKVIDNAAKIGVTRGYQTSCEFWVRQVRSGRH